MNFQEAAADIVGLLRRGVHEPLPEDEFTEFALRAFRFQCQANRAYGGFVVRRGVDPERVESWEDIPFLPTRAFKSTPLVSGDPAAVERVFRTSGTTRGRMDRGEHHVLKLELYRESLLPNFVSHLLPDLLHEAEQPTVLSLLPSPDLAPDSSLSFMMGEVTTRLGGKGSGFFVDSHGAVIQGGFWDALQAAEKAGGPVLVAGTAFSFVRWLEISGEKGWKLRLPHGSRVLETGGYKGRSRELSRAELYGALTESFGVEEGLIVNEYGMTELLSQFYEPVLAGVSRRSETRPMPDGTSPGLSQRFHRGPPWVRSRVLNPMTLEAVPSGETGVLAHLDLANLGSVAAILTEDLGRQVPGGFQLLGRGSGSEPRGCSLAMEDFLASQAVES